MVNIWRRQPSNRLSVRNLVRDQAVDASVVVTETFFEYEAPPAPPGSVSLRSMLGVGT